MTEGINKDVNLFIRIHLSLEKGQCPVAGKSEDLGLTHAFPAYAISKVMRAGALKRDATGLQISNPEHELLQLLQRAGFPHPVIVEPVVGTKLGLGELSMACLPWAEGEGPGKASGKRYLYGFRIEFQELVHGASGGEI